MITSGPGTRKLRHVAVLRVAMFLAVWLVLTLGNAADLPVGIAAAVAAAWASLHLLPPAASRPSLPALARFALRFIRQSVLAGVDVAWRALDPRLPLRTGFVVYPSRLPPGPARNAFCTVASLLPGTLPVEAGANGLLIHCLDIDQPVVADLTEDEDLFRRALGGGRDHG